MRSSAMSEDKPLVRRRDHREVEALHALRLAGAVQGLADRRRSRRGRVLLGRRRHALPRLQLAADGREHRPRRQAGGRRDRPSRRRSSPTSRRSWRTRRARASARSSRRSGRATWRRPSSPWAARRRTRTRSGSRRRSPGRQKILARYRSYHGATYATVNLTGDPRRWANENPPMPGIVHVLDPYRGTARGTEPAATALATLEETIELEGPQTIAAFILETVTGTNGILIPPDGYLAGRARALHPLRDRADRRRDHVRVRAHGRVVRGEPLGRRARPDDGREGAHLVVPAARRGRDQAPRSPRTSRRTCSTAGSRTTRTRCRARPRSPRSGVLEEDDLVGNAKRLDPVMRRHHEELMAKHPSVGPHPQHRPVRDHRAREEPRDDGAAVARSTS